jgi:hypothetical protein
VERHNRGLFGHETPPREVTIDLEIDSSAWNANKESIESLYDSTQVHGVTAINDDIYTRHTEPFKAEHVKRIISQVTVGPDITLEQRSKVDELIAEFADCFALAMTEVNAVPGAIHKLNIPSDTKFRTKLIAAFIEPRTKGIPPCEGGRYDGGRDHSSDTP